MNDHSSATKPNLDIVDADDARRRVLRGAVGNALLAATSGVLASLTFPPCELWWLAWVCLIPLFVALRQTVAVRASGWLGLLFGVTLCACSLHWMTSIFSTGAIALYVLASLPWVLFGLAYRVLTQRSSPAMVALMTPVLWLAAEWLRCEGWYFQFSWLQLGFSQVKWEGGLGLYHLVGVYGVTFLLVLVSHLLSEEMARDSRRKQRYGLVMVVAVLVLCAGVYHHLRHQTLYPVLWDGSTASVVQDETGDLSHLKELTLGHAVERAPSKNPLIVWPEYAVPDYPLSNPSLLGELREIARKTGSTLVLGCKEEAPKGVHCDGLRRRAMMTTEAKLFYNAALVIGPTGEVIGTYHKTHPIQFFSDGVPGRAYPTFPTPAGRIGIAICYDLDYASCALSLVRNGAELLVVPTFDAIEWTGLQHVQHSRMAQARAAEVDRFVVRATSSGISQVIGPDGTVRRSLPIGTSGVIPEEIVYYNGPWLSPYVRGFFLLPKVCVILSLLWLVNVCIGSCRRRGTR